MKRPHLRAQSRVIFGTFLLLLASSTAWSAPQQSAAEASAQIDALIDQSLSAAGLERNAPVDDNAFVRRVYLDVAGRIPTLAEAESFLSSSAPDKRSALIDRLLASDGYASNFYNYWADVLRVKSRNRKAVLVSYQDWIKESLKANKPYDQFVSEIITSEGFVWDNPAVGYYVRDAGMELDNLSNTMQVFTGTRMQCAQCHDHPFDTWTQLDYYHLAAYSYGTETQTKYRKMPAYEEFQRTLREVARAKAKADGGAQKGNRGVSVSQRRAARDIFEPFEQEVRPTDRKLRLPDDYQYSDAKPKQVVGPITPFGAEVKVKRGEDPRDGFADWMTSPENPRFTTVIANRLWKKVIGVGLIEPVDDWKEDTAPSHPELMAYLTRTMIDLDYDMKAYLRIVLNTRTYQSAVSPEEWSPEKTYAFQGPVLRRMTAEQIWDSALTIGIPDLDTRMGGDPQTQRLRENERTQQDHVEAVKSINGRQLYAIIQRLGEAEEKMIVYEKDIQSRLQNATDVKEKQVLRKEFADYRKQKGELLETLVTAVAEKNGYKKSSTMIAMGDGEEMDDSMRGNKKGARKNKGQAALVRASEIISPAPAGHFLSQFGQSDREIIESSHTEASIPQALALLNGQFSALALNQFSPLARAVKSAASPNRREDVVFLTILARLPNDRERELIHQQMERHGQRKGAEILVSALLNTQEFRFIQ